MPSRLAWNCNSRLLTAAPPSTRSSVIGAAASPIIAVSRAALWKAIDSSAARAMWATVVPRLRPRIAPFAAGIQYGAPSPVKEGTNITPPESGTDAARFSMSPECDTTCKPSRSHCTTAPPMKTLPSSAYCGSLPI